MTKCKGCPEDVNKAESYRCLACDGHFHKECLRKHVGKQMLVAPEDLITGCPQCAAAHAGH